MQAFRSLQPPARGNTFGTREFVESPAIGAAEPPGLPTCPDPNSPLTGQGRPPLPSRQREPVREGWGYGVSRPVSRVDAGLLVYGGCVVIRTSPSRARVDELAVSRTIRGCSRTQRDNRVSQICALRFAVVESVAKPTPRISAVLAQNSRERTASGAIWLTRGFGSRWRSDSIKMMTYPSNTIARAGWCNRRTCNLFALSVCYGLMSIPDIGAYVKHPHYEGSSFVVARLIPGGVPDRCDPLVTQAGDLTFMGPHADLTEHLFNLVGWDGSEFAGFRLEVMHPCGIRRTP